MTDQDFLDRAMIALAQHHESERRCVLSARILLQERNKFRTEYNEQDVEQFMKDLTEQYDNVLTRIAELEYKTENLIRVIEQNVTWINAPQTPNI